MHRMRCRSRSILRFTHESKERDRRRSPPPRVPRHTRRRRSAAQSEREAQAGGRVTGHTHSPADRHMQRHMFEVSRTFGSLSKKPRDTMKRSATASGTYCRTPHRIVPKPARSVETRVTLRPAHSVCPSDPVSCAHTALSAPFTRDARRGIDVPRTLPPPRDIHHRPCPPRTQRNLILTTATAHGHRRDPRVHSPYRTTHPTRTANTPHTHQWSRTSISALSLSLSLSPQGRTAPAALYAHDTSRSPQPPTQQVAVHKRARH